MNVTPPELNADTVLGVADGLDLILLSEDEVLVQFGTRSRPSELLRDGDLTGLLGRTLGRLIQGPATLRDLLKHLGPDREADGLSLLRELSDSGFICDIRRSPVEQYLGYTFQGEPHLSKARVLIVGAGPLGARIAQALIQHGLGSLTLLDDRIIDSQWSAFGPFNPSQRREEGRRADATLAELLGPPASSSMAPVDAAGIESAVSQADFVVLAREQPDLQTAHLVNRFAIRDSKAWMLTAIDGNFGLAGPLFLPGETACYNDFRTLSFAATPNRGMAQRHREHLVRRGAGSFFCGLPSYSEIVAGHAVLGIVHFLLRGSCFALGRVMVIDFDRMQIDVEDVLKLPRCPVCGSQKGAYRAPFPPASHPTP